MTNDIDQTIEKIGNTTTRASVAIAAGHAIIDASRVVGRTVWNIATVTAVATAALWLWLHWEEVLALLA